MGGSIPPDGLNITDNGLILDDDIALTDIEYGPLSPPLIAEEKEKPSTAPDPVSYMIGLVLGVVPRFGKFQVPPSTPLAEVVPEIRRRWSLGDLALEFTLMDPNGLYAHVPMTEQIGNIDHGVYSLMLREADHPAMDASLIASMGADVVPSDAPFVVKDDPEPTEPDTTKLLFRIEQRNNAEVRLVFNNKSVVGEVRQRIGEIVGVAAEAITLLFMGKALKDKFLIVRLRGTGDQGITVYIKEQTEILLLSAPSARRSG
jgi:hypothetical protein